MNDDNPTFVLDGARWFICRECRKYFSETGILRHLALKHEVNR